jgi:hypothetical protein
MPQWTPSKVGGRGGARTAQALAYDAVAGQARVSWARGDDAEALARMEPVLAIVLSGNSLTGSDVPLLIL